LKKAPILGAIAVFFAASLWAFDGALFRPFLLELDITVVVLLEHLIAFAIMSPFFMWEIKETRKLDGTDWLALIFIAVFGGAVGSLAITKALFMVNFENLSAIIILQKLQPLFAIFLAYIILKERPKKSFYPWAGVAIIGSYFITFGFQQPQFDSNSIFFAALLSLLAAFSFGSSTVFGKKIVKKINFRMATYLRFGLTTIIMLVIVSILGRLPEVGTVETPHLLLLFLIAFTTGGTAIFIYYWGLNRIMASKATIFELGLPITAVALDYFIHGQIMGPGQWLGAILIITSISIITRQAAEKN